MELSYLVSQVGIKGVGLLSLSGAVVILVWWPIVALSGCFGRTMLHTYLCVGRGPVELKGAMGTPTRVYQRSHTWIYTYLSIRVYVKVVRSYYTDRLSSPVGVF